MTGLSNLFSKVVKTNNNEIVKDNGKKADKIVKNLSKLKKLKNTKSKIYINIKTIEKPIFLTFSAKEAFNFLKQAFFKALIFQYFDFKCYIWIEINISSYAISKIFSQLNFNLAILNKSNLLKFKSLT